MDDIKFLNYTGLDLVISVGSENKNFPCGGYRNPVSVKKDASITSIKVKSDNQTANTYSIPETTITLPTSVTNTTVLLGIDPTKTSATAVGVVPYTNDALESTLFFNCVKDKVVNGKRAVSLTITAKGSGYVALPSTITSAMYKKRNTSIVKIAQDIIAGTTVCELPGAASLGLCSGPPSGSIFTKVWFYVLLFIIIIVVIAAIVGVVWWQKNKNK